MASTTTRATFTLPSPEGVRRLYRILLKHAGASVLYSKPATPNVRAWYRPEFDRWMQRAKGAGGKHDDELEWQEFARRAINTIHLMAHSSTTSGLADKLISNLGHLRYNLDPPSVAESGSHHIRTTCLKVSRPEFLRPKMARRPIEVQRVQAWDAMAEVAAMAEGSAGLLLGRARPLKRLAES